MTSTRRTRLFVLWLPMVALLGQGCGDPPAPAEDAGTDDAGSASDAGADAGSELLCARDLECDDDIFCNGAERCVPGATGADSRGCVDADGPPCEMSQTCNEPTDECMSDCGADPDADSDGHDAVSCGGDDCDDADAEVNPGVMEVCDMAGRDEDCVPSTLGPDADMDGYVFAMCCNVQADGSTLCGRDCDDTNGEINPDAIEVCNGLDDNCDGALDPTIEDMDMDGWAGCADLPVAMRDCDDASSDTYPGASELCDGLDNDCDGAATGEDVDDDGFLATDVTCTGGSRMDRPRTDCDDTTATIAPDVAEQCDAVDHNCDGDTDEAPAAMSCAAVPNTTFSCMSEACAVDSCGVGYGDCDVAPGNGCEEPLDSVTYCGSCTTSCSWECGAGVCNDPVRTVAGYNHGCSILADGTVRCWGANDLGQLGTGVMSMTPSLRPGPIVERVLVPIGIGPLVGVTQLSAGAFFSCALTSGGEVFCWGTDEQGQMAQRGFAGGNRPHAVIAGGTAPLSGATEIAAGFLHACALLSDATVACWGGNGRGQLGTTADPITTPTIVAGLPAIGAIAAGGQTTCALSAVGGEVWCWGDDGGGTLGRGTMVGDSMTPARVVAVSGAGSLTGVDEVAVGADNACARIGSEVVCWGSNRSGELGIGSTSLGSARPLYVLDGASRLSGATSISAGASFACAAVAGGVRCWGRNHVGQLGDGTSTDPQLSPTTVMRDSGGALRGVTGLVESSVSTCVQVGSDPWCWGQNVWGNLGSGDRVTRTAATPVLPPLLP